MKKLIISILSISLYLNLFVSSASAYYTNMPASVVIGQPDFTSNALNQGGSPAANTLRAPYDAIIVNELLIVSDYNQRVLIYNTIPTTNNASANVVIGQTDFSGSSRNQGGTCTARTLSSPNSIYSDGTKLIIPDGANNRVLIYNTIPTTNNAPADVVIGQPDFTSCSSNQGGSPTANTLASPLDVWVDGSKLFIVDDNNNRVLIYNTIPTTNNAPADVVIGQPDFTSNLANQGNASPAANTLWYPSSVFSYNGKLFIAELYTGDNGNKRVLIYNTIPTTNNAPADVVIGQPDFTSNLANQGGGPEANTLYSTRFPWIYNGKLFIPEDQGNNRILIYNTIPTTNNAPADVVIGQPDFTSNLANQGGGPQINTVNRPTGGFANNTYMVIADRINNRVLIFDNYDNITTPTLTLNYPIENISDQKLKISGNVILGEYGKYSLNKLQYSLNNQGFANVSQLSARQQGETDTIYEFSQELEPWNGFKPKDQWNESLGYTLKLKAISYNADTEENYLFHFSHFTLESVNQEESQPHFNFIVPLDHIQTIKNNINNFEVYLDSQKYLTNISPDNINAETGRVYISINTNNISSQPINLPAGEHEVHIKAQDNWGHSFDSNTLTVEFSSPIYSSGGSLTNSSWFPLQINSISGVNTGILSSFNPSSVKPNYTTTNLNPTIKGIAFAGAEVTLTVINQNSSEETKNYSVTVNPDSTFTLNPVLYTNSLVTISVRDVLGNFTQLPTIYLKQ